MADFGISGLSAAYLATAEDAAQEAINTWLSNTDTVVGAAVHITTMLTVETALVGINPLVNNQQWNSDQQMQQLASYLAGDPSYVKWYNEIFKLTMYPNIEGIIIYADGESGSRRVDVSEQPLVVQADMGSTTYAMDNAVPHPREWSLKGYLMSSLPTDHYYILKPSIVAQKTYLDMCMQARRPVWYKTYDNIFVKVLITAFDYSWDPKAMNGLQVNIQLKEYVPFKVHTGLAIPSELEAIGKYRLV